MLCKQRGVMLRISWCHRCECQSEVGKSFFTPSHATSSFFYPFSFIKRRQVCHSNSFVNDSRPFQECTLCNYLIFLFITVLKLPKYNGSSQLSCGIHDDYRWKQRVSKQSRIRERFRVHLHR